ncbi:glycosyltransferase family 1 protein [Chryseobacterium lactis]|uniref:Glycosyltransferase family 1 protein n=1 Tax=Chryseobacterium lactis TaxID=1241981 RepID=A0A3G6RSG8_CHRLC|nr:glycosyltransferase family 1 protein [Chryseobacterium lactis]AZA80936.1 glycosyltransferase family 1 protein [Chryseobacterium lactis]AZB05937.1 glycosyltransferase family 1 protein [Chryseobacterium lactis]PNW13343.1 glycosyltransferase family 1 protein [Chryseobacterium lactis]
MRIKLIFDIEVIGNAYKNNQTGIFRVAYELFKRFISREEIELSYSNFNFNNHKETQFKIDRFLSDHQLTLKNANNCERVKFIPFRKEKPFRKLYNKLGIFDYKVSYNEGIQDAQIYHSLYYPIHKSLEEFPNVKKVVTIHDLIPILYPEYNDNTQLLDNTIKSIGPNNYAICVSENTRKDLLEYAPYIDPKKVFVSRLAASPDIFYQSSDAKENALIREKYNLPEKYILSLSTLEPRKNIDHLIRSFIKMLDTHSVSDLSLVLVGSKGWQYDKIFEEYENAKDLKGKIIITGRIPDEDLASVYSQANSFYYMSLYEGFGLPPLEAMQCGIPTVTSNTSSLPEVVGEAGIQLDPTDENALSEVIWKLYNDEEYRMEYAQKAIERAKEFSWEKAVEEHINIYNAILE